MAVDGTYKIEIDTPIGKQEATLILVTAGATLTGKIESAMGKSDFSGVVKENEVSWDVKISSPIGKMTLSCQGRVNGCDISGEVKAGNFGTSPFKGKRL
jgi:hypothetical protein